jgi:hypothetical protein
MSTATARALATSAALAAATACSTTKSASTRSTALSRSSLVDADRAALKFRPIEFLDSADGLVRIRHLNEAKAPRLAGGSVDHHDGTIDLACLRE